MSKDKAPQTYWTNWMVMESSLSAAKDVTPKAEWEDLRCYVEHSAYAALEAKLAECVAALSESEYALDRIRIGVMWLQNKEWFEEVHDKARETLARVKK